MLEHSSEVVVSKSGDKVNIQMDAKYFETVFGGTEKKDGEIWKIDKIEIFPFDERDEDLQDSDETEGTDGIALWKEKSSR